MKQTNHRLFIFILILGMLVSCGGEEPDPKPQTKPEQPEQPQQPQEPQEPEDIESQLAKMSLRQKVGQMFIVRPESLDTNFTWQTNSDLTQNAQRHLSDKMIAVYENYPVGGIILYAHNINNEVQIERFTTQIHGLSGSPLVCIDEEGGLVARIANNQNFRVEKFESMAAIGNTGDPKQAYYCGNVIGTYLKKYGIDINFAPVADVNTNPENIVIGSRAFSDKPEVAAPMVVNYLQGLSDAGVVGCMKHFPGHGDTFTDTHYGYAETLKTWQQMLDCEMITFRAGIDWGAQLIMTAHIAAPNVTGKSLPATMSSVMLQDKLRGELGYQNLIITDGMEMGAITQQYTSGEAAVGAIVAGADIILGPLDLVEAFDAVVAAVETGVLTEERLNESVRRILALKQTLK